MDSHGCAHVTAEMKVVVLGDSRVGKTSVISQFTQTAGFTDTYTPTMGVDYDTALIQVDGQSVRLHVYDTSGMPSFLWLAKTPIQDADGFVFIYDVTEKDSFTSLERWNEHVNRFAKDKHMPKMLLGNKSDLRHRQTVSTSTAREFGIPEGMIQLETSARLGKCTHVPFTLLASEILKHRKLGTVQVMGAPTNMGMFTSEMFEEQPVERLRSSGDLEDYTHLFKIMLVGAPRVGKTSIRYRFCKDHYSSEYFATAGFDYSTRSLIVDNERVKVQVWDVSGDSVYDMTRQSYYNGANGFLIVYDCTVKESFSKAELLLKQLALAGLDRAPKVLLGNKCDATKKKAPEFATAKDFADGWRIPVLETSAKYSTNVDTAFMKVVLALKRQLAPWKRIYNWS